MEKQAKPFYKRWWFWVIVFLFLLVMGNLNTGKKETTAPDPESEVAEETAEPQSIEDQLTSIVDSVIKDKSELNVVQKASDKTRYNISMNYDEASWDETYFVSAALTAYIKICQEAYKIDGVDAIELYLLIPMIDAKGNEITEVGFTMIMTKDKFSTYTWSNLAYREGIYDTVAADCEQLVIHAGVKNKVDFNKVMYKE